MDEVCVHRRTVLGVSHQVATHICECLGSLLIEVKFRCHDEENTSSTIDPHHLNFSTDRFLKETPDALPGRPAVMFDH